MKKMLIISYLVSLMISACQYGKESNLTEAERSHFLSEGERISGLSFDTLRNSLLAAIGTRGLAGAIPFCHQEAGALTAVYDRQDISVSRTSLKYRNPANKPDSQSVVVLRQFDERMAKGEKPAPVLLKSPDGDIHYYKPIMMQALCLNCHGQIREEIQPTVLRVIDSLYPGDQARGYRAGDIRGAWHIVFRSKKS
jgi:hypothetical protein